MEITDNKRPCWNAVEIQNNPNQESHPSTGRLLLKSRNLKDINTEIVLTPINSFNFMLSKFSF